MFMCFFMITSSWMVYQGHILGELSSSFLSKHWLFIFLHLGWGLAKFHHWIHWHFTDLITQVLFGFLRFHGWRIVKYNFDPITQWVWYISYIIYMTYIIYIYHTSPFILTKCICMGRGISLFAHVCPCSFRGQK